MNLPSDRQEWTPSQPHPLAFSIRGPHGTLPWVAIVDDAPMLMWARTREEAERIISSWHRDPQTVRVFRVQNPNHHLGSARVVQLSELA